jgi:hypothetical protein
VARRVLGLISFGEESDDEILFAIAAARCHPYSYHFSQNNSRTIAGNGHLSSNEVSIRWHGRMTPIFSLVVSG